MVMCDKTPSDGACKTAKAFPTHFVCDGKHESCTEIAKGYKPAAELTSMLASAHM